MYFEEPAYAGSLKARWSDQANDHMKDRSALYGRLLDAVWFDVNRTAVHELGHTLGIDDLSGTPHMGVMSNIVTWQVPTGDDYSYLEQIYLAR